MTPPSSPPRSQSPIYEWPPHDPVAFRQRFVKLGDPVPKRIIAPKIDQVRNALEKCGIVNEHVVQALMEIIEDKK